MLRLPAVLLLVMCQATLAATVPKAAKEGASPSQPGRIRLCDADNPGWCWTYTRNGDHYDGVGDRGGSRTMTLESFSSQSVVMRMTQAGRPGWYSVNSGRMSSEGNSLTAGEWSDSNGGKGHITATWEASTSKAAAASSTKAPTAAAKQPAAKNTTTKPVAAASGKSEAAKGAPAKAEAPAQTTTKAPTRPTVPAEPAK